MELIDSVSLPGRRRERILEWLKVHDQATIPELAEHLGVSQDTVRRDLDACAAQGLLVRTRGGALPVSDWSVSDLRYPERVRIEEDAKARIGLAAANLLEWGSTVIVNGGTTTLSVLRSLGEHRGLTLVTNHVRAVHEVPLEAIRSLYILGGEFIPDANVTVGRVGFAEDRDIVADVAIIGVGGIMAEQGILSRDVAEGQKILDMIRCARRVIVVADHTKFSRHAFYRIAGLEDVDLLVTDEPPEGELADALTAAGVEVVLAP